MEDETSSILSFQDLEEEEEGEDTVSLRDLSTAPFDPEESEPYTVSSVPSPSKQDVFEFSNICLSTEAVSNVDTILFCGKAIPFEEPGYLRLPNSSFKRLRSSGRESADARLTRSESLCFPCSKAGAVPAAGSCRYSTSSGSWRYKALIGVTKFPSRMDMGEIRRRQSRQAPTPLFPAGTDGGSMSLSAEGGRGHGHQGLLKLLSGRSHPLSARSHPLSALARASLGWIRRV